MAVSLGASQAAAPSLPETVLRISAPTTDAHLAALDQALGQMVRIADSVARTAAEVAATAQTINACCQSMMAGQSNTDDMCMQVMRAVDDLAAAVAVMGEPHVEVPVTVQPAPPAHTELAVMPPRTKTIGNIKRDQNGNLVSAEVYEQ